MKCLTRSFFLAFFSRTRTFASPVSSPSQPFSGNEENLNPDSVLRNLRQTTQNMQKYGYVTPGDRHVTPRHHQSESPSVPSLSGSNDISPMYNDHSVVPVYAAPAEQLAYLTTLGERMAASVAEYAPFQTCLKWLIDWLIDRLFFGLLVVF